ncbi:signal peptidase II [Candidatus Woesearchaeota archaeon]|nr:signal peptidase II [Candidatus Woesearchaeota archaeon]|tara:strand:- start:3661 stop:4104 length:444 start_codon:yes stop_codon:yes gene_type:complete
MKKAKLGFMFIAIILILVDQLTKFLVMRNLSLSQSVPVIKNILHITLIKNTGAAFGIFRNTNTVLIWVTVIVIGFILFYFDKIADSKLSSVFTAFILSGAVGNLIDRIRLGYVVDFIDFGFWPAFNVADSAIVVGVIGLVVFCSRKS